MQLHRYKEYLYSPCLFLRTATATLRFLVFSSSVTDTLHAACVRYDMEQKHAAYYEKKLRLSDMISNMPARAMFTRSRSRNFYFKQTKSTASGNESLLTIEECPDP